MERRRSVRRADTAITAAPSPLSDHNTSPHRHQSTSFSAINNIPDNDTATSHHRPPNFPLHRTPNPPSSPSLPNRKSTPDSPHHHLHKQRSSDDLQMRLLWPSSKKLNPSNDAKPAAASEDKKVEKGRRSMRHNIGKIHLERPLKKPGTPPSPSPASGPMHSGRLSFNVASRANKRSDFDVDFPSTESEPSRARRPESPLKGKNVGVGSLISQGFNNLFRRKSFQGCSGSPGRERGVAVAAADGEMQNKLRILHNYLIQWRFVNAGTVVVNNIKCDNAEVRMLWGNIASFV